ncbi:hypothetical protein J056_003815 [Wallemia ichthyophaga EXF-994]|uniref:Uncharacterized protein n=1 Tax=Wallemia ichthyophaga (strain EXF-994 / CBS 113033) TaxID=1299270 RepID=R9A8U6_WALI9|nr:uncharacterized protein J056_003815 [Wallemia ichthyophaga EXF-994]EOQ98643.1 hypothetical protein J056_003815 [Wallemia ichthyophaga EXF-994]
MAIPSPQPISPNSTHKDWLLLGEAEKPYSMDDNPLLFIMPELEH